MKRKYTKDEALEYSKQYFDDELAASVFVSKYALRDNDGNFLEKDPNDAFDRLAREFSRIEDKYPNPVSYEKIRSLLHDFKYIVAQGSPMAGVGNYEQVQSLSNCYVIAPPHDSYGGILRTDQELVQIAKRRGGVGTDLSTIRPKGMPTKNSAKTTDGIAVFMERYSNSCREVAQSGRRGALMLTISCEHPEIETFIDIKSDLTKVTGANISIRLTNEFMNAVRSNSDFTLRWPVHSSNPKMTKVVKARDIWNKIIHSAWKSAEPGIIFWDTLISNGPHNLYEEFRSVSTNPCLTKDTWIMTSDGPKFISDLIGKKFNASLNGSSYSSTDKGFFSSGVKKIFSIKTKRGPLVKATWNHKFLTKDGWKEVSQLQKGDKIKIDNGNYNWGNDSEFGKGWLVGSVFGDGNIEENKANLSYWGKTKYEMQTIATSYIKENLKCRADIGTGKDLGCDKVNISCKALVDIYSELKMFEDGKKKTSELLEKASSSFQKGFLSGWFDADGSPQGNRKKGVNIRLASIDKDALYYAQRALLRFGIYSKVHENRKKEGYRLLPDGHGGYKEYFCQNMHELVIANNSIKLFHEIIGFKDSDKNKRLNDYIVSYNRNINKDKNYFIVESVLEIGEEEVFDCTIPQVESFNANGLVSHNCSELDLCADDSCRLMLLNLFSYVVNPFTEDSYFDFVLFKEHAKIAQRLMDDLIDLEVECIDRIIEKIDSDPEPEDIKRVEKELWERIKIKAERGRRTGLGITALGDCLAALGYQYGSDQSIDQTEVIYSVLASSAHDSSIELAKERGAFPAFDYELEKDHQYLNKVILDKEGWKKYGRRNISLTTTAPVGSMSIETKTTSGIEPVFMLSYKRRKKITSENDRVDFVDQVGDKWQEFIVYHDKYNMWKQKNPDKILYESPYYKATAMDIDWKQSVKIQAAAQKWVDHSISKTCNLPSTATEELVAEVYMSAWESGCKGFTVYRDGCRSGVLVSNTETKKNEQPKFKANDAYKRPKHVDCTINHVSVKGEKWIVLVGEVDGLPYELFGGKAEKIQFPQKYKSGILEKEKGKGNSKYNLIIKDDGEDFIIKDIVSVFDNPEYALHTRLLSLSMRHGSPVKYIVEQLQKDKDSSLFDFSKVIARVLKKYIQDGESSQKCEKCSQNLSFEEGCLTCKSCGYSKCG